MEAVAGGAELGDEVGGSYTFKSAGAGQSHTFTVVDVAGNTSSVTVGPVNIDTTAPTVTVKASTSQTRPTGLTSLKATISGKISDLLSGVASASYSIRDSAGQLSFSGALTPAADGSYSFTTLLDGRTAVGAKKRTYTITVSAQDKAGNLASSSTTVVA